MSNFQIVQAKIIEGVPLSDEDELIYKEHEHILGPCRNRDTSQEFYVLSTGSAPYVAKSPFQKVPTNWADDSSLSSRDPASAEHAQEYFSTDATISDGVPRKQDNHEIDLMLISGSFYVDIPTNGPFPNDDAVSKTETTDMMSISLSTATDMNISTRMLSLTKVIEDAI